MQKYNWCNEILEYLDAIAIINIDNNEVVYSNNYAGTLLGIKAKKVDYSLQLTRFVLKLLKQKSGHIVQEYTTEDSKNGILQSYSIELAPLKDEKKYLCRIIDKTYITELYREMETKRRLSSLGEMAAGLAHEIRNPLNAILGSVQLVAEELPADFKYCHLLDGVAKEITGLENLVRSFLDFSNIQVELLDDINFEDLINDLLFIYYDQFEKKNIKFNKKIECKSVHIKGDYTKLKMVFSNLIRNAAEAIDRDGTIDFNIKKILNLNKLPYYKISVRDSGKGIRSEHLSKIFNPFFTTKSRGTGLGLAIAYQIIDRHDGLLEVDSKPKVGTIFTVYLPEKEE